MTPSSTYADAAGRYRLDSRIATGGMGEVWHAVDTVLGRAVAVKVLKGEYADDATFRSRFETEARHAASLHHPGVAAVFDFGEGPARDAGAPRPFLVMELVDGKPLSALLQGGRPLDPEVARDLLAQASDAIAAAHAAGIVHRDVKPANLLVTPVRRVKITDFGIARAAEGMALTQTGQVIGTPQYLSPEQAEGRTATAASDVYSLGVVLYECLAGTRPFTGESPVAVALAHLRTPVPPLPSSVPSDLSSVCLKALSKDPADRYPHAGAFAAALRARTPAPAPVSTVEAPVAAAAAQAGPAATQVLPATTVQPAVGPRRRRRTPLWPFVLVVLLLLALIGWALWREVNAPVQPSNPPASQTPTTTAPTTPTTPTPTGIQVEAADYVGEPVEDAKDQLEDLGFRVSTEKVDNPGDQVEGTVEGVSPSGFLEEGEEITLTYWDKPPKDDESESPTSDETTDEPGNSGGQGKGNDG